MGIGTTVAAVACYAWLSRTVELRPDVTELSPAGRWAGLGRGFVIGFATLAATMLLIGLFGGWDQIVWGSFGGFLVSFGAMASVAVNEELLFRGVVFRIPGAAVAVSK